jgi:hypothetical protein
LSGEKSVNHVTKSRKRRKGIEEEEEGKSQNPLPPLLPLPLF